MQSSADTPVEEVRLHAEALLGCPVTEITSIAGGANNRVYRASAGTARYAIKLYPASVGDDRDRLGSETGALRFLKQHGVRAVPGLIGADRAHRIGIYEWIEGEPIAAARDTDIESALSLLAELHGLRTADAASDLPAASEACLSGAEIIRQVERRLARLRQVAGEEPELRRLIEEGIAPTLAAGRGRAERVYDRLRLDFANSLTPERRSLSPSDFGFHNARRTADGSLMFYDFEYFGWDDPVKPVSDFVLHPGMTMTDAQRRHFVGGAERIYGADRTYAPRLRALFPLYGLRWSLILLNEFLPERWARRLQAGVAVDRRTAVARQLAKAQAMLEIANTSLTTFPYGE